MMKMLIKLDEDKIRADGKYDVVAVWKWIDKRFENACTKEIQSDGAVLYSGDPQRDYYTCIGLAYLALREQKWFASYCRQWIWYDNDDDEELPYQDMNVLLREKHDNPLFARV